MNKTYEPSFIVSKKHNKHELEQRQSNQLKFRHRMKIQPQDDMEMKNIHQRVKICESYLKDLRSIFIKRQANRILRKDRTIKHSSVNRQPILMDRQIVNSRLVNNQAQKQKRYSIRLKTQQEQLSKSRFIVEYQLSPLQNKRQRQKEGRFISQFEKNIRQKLQKIQLNKYGDIEQFDDIIRRSQDKQINSIKRPDKISKTNSLKLHYPSAQNHLRKKNITISNKNGRTTDVIQSQRYESLRSKIDRCRTELSQRQKNEIDRISHQDIDYHQKNKILSKYYQKYSSNNKNGDPQALNLMCMATLARADLLLKQI